MNPQNEWVLQQQREVLSMAASARASIDQRSQQLVQAAGLILVLTGLVKVPVLLVQSTLLTRVALVIAFFAFAGMIGLSLRIWWPQSFTGPGSQNWDEVWQSKIAAEEEEAFVQVFADYKGAINDLEAVNKQKAKNLKVALILFGVQIAGLWGPGALVAGDQLTRSHRGRLEARTAFPPAAGRGVRCARPGAR